MKCKIAAVQIACTIGKVQENVEHAVMYIQQAIADGAQIICLPEMFNTGYFSHTSHVDTAYWDLAETTDGYTISTMVEIAREQSVVLIVPFVELSAAGVMHNSACVIDADGRILGIYRKVHMPWSHTGWEKFYFRPGYQLPVFDTRYGRIGVLICYDRDFPELARSLALQGAEILCIPNGTGKAMVEVWKALAATRAYENQVFLLGNCLVGKVDAEHHEFSGHSLLCDPYGRIIDCLGYEEGVLLAEIDTNEIAKARTQRFMYRDRRPEMYAELVKMK